MKPSRYTREEKLAILEDYKHQLTTNNATESGRIIELKYGIRANTVYRWAKDLDFPVRIHNEVMTDGVVFKISQYVEAGKTITEMANALAIPTQLVYSHVRNRYGQAVLDKLKSHSIHPDKDNEILDTVRSDLLHGMPFMDVVSRVQGYRSKSFVYGVREALIKEGLLPSSVKAYRSKRATKEQRQAVLRDAEQIGVLAAAEKYGYSKTIVYAWRNEEGNKNVPTDC